MAETLTVVIDDGGTYTVTVRGVGLFTDQGLTSPASFPASVSAQTTWYAAAPSAHGRRPNIEVLVTASDGTRVQVDTFNSLPATVNLTEGSVDLSGPSSSGTSLPDQTGQSGKVLGTDGTNPEWVSGGSSAVAWTPVKTANYAASSGQAVPGNASGGGFNVTLPAPAANARVTVKNVGATGTVTVLPHAAETIDGAASYPIDTQWMSRDFQSDGTNWLVV